MRAVAMATPARTVPRSFRLFSRMPARPPNRAIRTSKTVGLVRASSSVGFVRFSGDSRKNSVEASSEMATITNRFLKASLSRSRSFVPIARPTPMIGPISGEMSIAPMTTAVEFTFRPTEAMMMENARIHTFGPRNQMELLMRWAASSVSMWS